MLLVNKTNVLLSHNLECRNGLAYFDYFKQTEM